MARKQVIPDRRNRILETAYELFLHYTVEKTTMDDISRHSKVPRATVYLEFPGGKEDILMTLVDINMATVIAEFQQALADAKDGEYLKAAQKILVRSAMNSKEKTAAFFLDFDSLERVSKRICKEKVGFFEQRGQLLQQALDSAVTAKEILPCDTKRVAAMINHAYLSFKPPMIQHLSNEEVEQQVNLFLELLFNGLKQPSSASTMVPVP